MVSTFVVERREPSGIGSVLTMKNRTACAVPITYFSKAVSKWMALDAGPDKLDVSQGLRRAPTAQKFFTTLLIEGSALPWTRRRHGGDRLAISAVQMVNTAALLAQAVFGQPYQMPMVCKEDHLRSF